MTDKSSKNAIYGYIVSIIILTIISILMGIKGMEQEDGIRVRLLFILVPAIFVLLGNLIKNIINIFIKGLISSALEKMSVMLGWGIAIFLFLFLLPGADRLNKASFGVPFLTLIIVFNSCFYEFIKNNIIFSRIVKALLYFLQGVILRLMIGVLWDNGAWNIGFKMSIGDMVLFGHLILVASALMSILELSQNTVYKKMGNWFSKNPLLKFFVGCAIVLYFKDIRAGINDHYPQLFVYVEWVGIFIALLIIFIVAFSKIQQDRAPQFHERFGRHVQEIVYNKSYDGREVTMFLENYVSRGELSGILAFLVGLAKERMIPDVEISRLIKPITDFKAMEIPKLCYRSEYDYIMNMNMDERKKLVEIVIWNIKNYGRNNSYDYQNGYRRYTSDMREDHQ